MSEEMSEEMSDVEDVGSGGEVGGRFLSVCSCIFCNAMEHVLMLVDAQILCTQCTQVFVQVLCIVLCKVLCAHLGYVEG